MIQPFPDIRYSPIHLVNESGWKVVHGRGSIREENGILVK